MLLGALPVLTGVCGATGLNARWPVTGVAGSILGLASGVFGGLAGNQGGLRAAALIGSDLSPTAFVATSTATALMVDAARTPVNLVRSGATLAEIGPVLLFASAGVLLGTILGERILIGIRPPAFRRAVSVLIGAIGMLILWRTA